ncbi:MAG: hypothetical protein JW920_02645, partial [Deltaproteobacteria bacterium]|nr:hypothetical protein [Deltaproteobacteria bacterium]
RSDYDALQLTGLYFSRVVICFQQDPACYFYVAAENTIDSRCPVPALTPRITGKPCKSFPDWPYTCLSFDHGS